MNKTDKLHKRRQKPVGLLLFVLVELAIAYGFFSLSVDRGNLWWYLLTVVFLIGAFGNLFKLLGSLFHGKRQAK